MVTGGGEEEEGRRNGHSPPGWQPLVKLCCSGYPRRTRAGTQARTRTHAYAATVHGRAGAWSHPRPLMRGGRRLGHTTAPHPPRRARRPHPRRMPKATLLGPVHSKSSRLWAGEERAALSVTPTCHPETHTTHIPRRGRAASTSLPVVLARLPTPAPPPGSQPQAPLFVL